MTDFGAGALVAGIGNRRALKHTNQNFNATMAFNQQQSETQYQRAVTDMMKAGLNPMLAYSQGGNSASSVSQPAVVNESTGVGEGISRSVSQALQNRDKKIDTNLANRINTAQVAKLTAETEGQKIQNKIMAETANWSGLSAKGNTEGVLATAEKLGQEALGSYATADKTVIDKNRSGLDYELQQKLVPLLIELQGLTNKGTQLGIPEKEAEAAFWNALGGAGKGGDAAKAAPGMIRDIMQIIKQLRGK